MKAIMLPLSEREMLFYSQDRRIIVIVLWSQSDDAMVTLFPLMVDLELITEK